MTNRNLLAENLNESFGDAFVDARPFGSMAYLLGFRGKGTVEEFFATNKDAILAAFRKSGAAERISDPRPIDLEPGKICFMV
jgi:hypothetical protein